MMTRELLVHEKVKILLIFSVYPSLSTPQCSSLISPSNPFLHSAVLREIYFFTDANRLMKSMSSESVNCFLFSNDHSLYSMGHCLPS